MDLIRKNTLTDVDPQTELQMVALDGSKTQLHEYLILFIPSFACAC